MVYLLLIIAIIIFDQFTKKIAERKLQEGKYEDIIKNKLQVVLLKNYGAAFNIFNKKRRFLIIITLPALLFMTGYLISILGQGGDVLLKLTLSFIIGGGIGNLIDRLIRGYVVDFIYFNIKKFPVFNFADFFVFAGEFMVIYMIIVGYI